MITNRNTLLIKFGIDNPSKIPNIQKKKKFNNLRKYHLESPNQLDSVKIKKRQTLIRNFGPTGFANSLITKKRELTCLAKYGVRNVQQLHTFQK